MGAPFSDITLYAPTPHEVGTPEYREDTSLKNFVSDLYVQMMHGYKPPKTTRVTIQPAFHNIWQGSNRIGSIVSIAPYYSYEDYAVLDKAGKYKYILDLIQGVMLQLSDEHGWDKAVFERAYAEVIKTNFQFHIDYPQKHSRDKNKKGSVSIEKSEMETTLFVCIEVNGVVIKRKLFEKKNGWCNDAAYLLARHSKWFDNDRFGISYSKGKLEMWYSISQDDVTHIKHGNRVKEIDFSNFFLIQYYIS